MIEFIEDTYKFNKLGDVSQEQSYKNLIGGCQLVEEETKELRESLLQFMGDKQQWTKDNRADALDAIVDILVTAIGVGYRAGFTRQQIELAMSIIAEQNLNKYSRTEEDAVKSVEKYKDDDRYSNVHWEAIDIHGETYYAVIGETETGNRKVLKGIHHVDPKGFLKEICK